MGHRPGEVVATLICQRVFWGKHVMEPSWLEILGIYASPFLVFAIWLAALGLGIIQIAGWRHTKPTGLRLALTSAFLIALAVALGLPRLGFGADSHVLFVPILGGPMPIDVSLTWGGLWGMAAGSAFAMWWTLGRSKPAAASPGVFGNAISPMRAGIAQTFSGAPDVFISYKREERAKVVEIARRLEALKLKVWFDAQMRSGTTFDAEIDRQVRAAKAVLVCWSPGAVTSDWVRGEATIGRQRGVLAAALLGDCDMPAPFNLVHAEDLKAGPGGSHAAWVRLVDRIGDLVGRAGLGAFERLQSNPARSEIANWISLHPEDPLVEVALQNLQRLAKG